MFHTRHLGLQTLLLGAIAYARLASSASVPPESCNPNFQGQAQTIYTLASPDTDNSVNKWNADSLSPGAHVVLETQALNNTIPQNQFLVQFTGQPDGSYNLKSQAEANPVTALTAGANGELTIDILSLSASIPSQRFTIDCKICASTGAGTGAGPCTITNPDSGLCIVGTNPGDVLRLGPCSEAGIYQFQEAISA